MRFERRLLGFFLVLVAIFFLTFPGRGEALDIDKRFGFEGSFEVLERDIETDNLVLFGPNFPDGLIIPGEVVPVQSLRLLGKFSLRIVDAVEIFGLVGGSDLEIDDLNFRSDFSGAWGGGAKIILYREDSREGSFQVFADYRFLRFEVNDRVSFTPFVNEATVPGRDIDGNGQASENKTVLLTDQLVNEEIDWTEHVVRFGLRGRHAEFEPYGGIRFSFVDGKENLPLAAQGLIQAQNLNLDFKQDDTFGIFFGTSYYLSRSERASLFIEANLLDQYALAGGVRIGF